MSENEKKTILVLEDDQSLLDAITHQFVMNGFNVISSKNTDEGLYKLEKEGPVDVIWLDHYLIGEKDGLDFVIKIKSSPRWKDIPVFVVSNSSGNKSIQSYMRLGVDQYYTKSDYDLQQIINDIKFSIEKKKD